MFKDFDTGKYRLAQLHREAEQVRLLALLKYHPQKIHQQPTAATNAMKPLKTHK
jgi:hypothetical protein